MLTTPETERLDEIIDLAETHADALSQWEQEFLDDITTRYRRYVEFLTLSSRQWDILERILSKMEATLC